MKKIISLILTISMLSTFAPSIVVQARNHANIRIGDYIQMGTYYGEPILWRCVGFEKITGYDAGGNPIIDSTDITTEYNDGYLPLMLSDKIICIKPYDASGFNESGSHGRADRVYYDNYGVACTAGSNYWGDSNIRNWLNSSDSEGNVNWSCGNPPDKDHVNDYSANEGETFAYSDEAGFLTNFTVQEVMAIRSVTQKSLLTYEEYENMSLYGQSYYGFNNQYGYNTIDEIHNYETAYSEYISDTVFLLDNKQANNIYNNSNILGEDYYVGKPTKSCRIRSANSEDLKEDLEAGYEYYDYWLRSPYCDKQDPHIQNDKNCRSENVQYISPTRSGSAWYEATDANRAKGIRPAFYLATNVDLETGSGTMLNPYIIGGNNIENAEDEIALETQDVFPESITIDYNSERAKLGLEYITANDPNATFKVEDEKVATLGEVLQVLEIGKTEYDDISIQILPKSPGKTVITAHFSDGTTKKCNLTVTGIKIIFNGEELEFDQPPINQNGNLLVPIRKIAESMGKTVLWSDKANAAFIDNTNNALIVPIGETTLYLGDEKSYSKWETVKTNVPSQVINGRTLVPIRQFSEALGADVNWIDKYSTATISYDNVESKAMSSSLYDAINMNYYIDNYGENPFIWYTDNVINPFYDSRNSTVDAITMGMDKPWNVITDLWSGIYGDTNASIIIQETLYDVLNEVPEDENYDLDLSLLKDIKSYSENGLKIFKETKGFDAKFLKNHKNLKYLNDSLLKAAESDTTGTVFDIFDWTVFTVEEVAYLLSDYSVNISYLDVLENALDNQGVLDYAMQEAIDDLRAQYADKFTEVVLDIQKEIIDNAFGTAMSTVTGAGYGVGKFVWDKIIFNVTGVNKKGSALKTFYGIYCYNEALDREFSNELVESKTDIDINYIKALINLQKATKKTAINSIADMANWWAKDEVNQSADELKTSLNSWSYYTWENTNAVNNGGNNGGGGGSW